MAKRNTPSLIDVAKEFGTEEQCIAYLERMRFPSGLWCVKCTGDQVSKFVSPASVTKRSRKNRKTGLVEVKETRVPIRYLYQCLNPECKHQFSPTSGTIFHDSHLPLSTWFMATALIVNAKKGLSAKQLERDLAVSYPTAWHLYHRIREAMTEGNVGMFTGETEVDATFVGGNYDPRRKRSRYDKAGVGGVLQRRIEAGPSQVRVFRIPAENKESMWRLIDENIALDAQVFTDEHQTYVKLGSVRVHEIVKHGRKEWVRGKAHTNGLEGFWSLFKRGLIGQYHKVSVKHLGRYLNEFQFRFNNREAEDLFALVLLRLVIGQALTRAELTGTSEEPF